MSLSPPDILFILTNKAEKQDGVAYWRKWKRALNNISLTHGTGTNINLWDPTSGGTYTDPNLPRSNYKGHKDAVWRVERARELIQATVKIHVFAQVIVDVSEVLHSIDHRVIEIVGGEGEAKDILTIQADTRRSRFHEGMKALLQNPNRHYEVETIKKTLGTTFGGVDWHQCLHMCIDLMLAYIDEKKGGKTLSKSQKEALMAKLGRSADKKGQKPSDGFLLSTWGYPARRERGIPIRLEAYAAPGLMLRDRTASL